jgi:hypothetical protein
LRNKIQSRWAFVLPLALIGLLLLAGNASANEDQPTIAKDSIQVTAYTFNVYHKSADTWSWVPLMSYRVNGPIPSGSQLYAEFAVPGAGPVKFDCRTEETQKGRSWKTECGGHDIPEDKGSLYTGTVDFAIKMRNELAGGDAALFTGHIKVAKVHSNEYGPKVVNHFVYYVDHDLELAHRVRLPYARWRDGDESPNVQCCILGSWRRGHCKFSAPSVLSGQGSRQNVLRR